MSTNQTNSLLLPTGTETTVIEAINPEDFIRPTVVQIRQASKKRPAGLDSERIEQYARDMIAGEKFPSIQAIRANGRPGKFVVFDGFHRIAALDRALVILRTSFNHEGWNGITAEPTLNATIHEGRFSQHQLRYMAFRANAKHGLGLSFKERKAGFEAFILGGLFLLGTGSKRKPMSLRQIGREFGIDHKTVASRLKNGDRQFRKIYEAYFQNEDGHAQWEAGPKLLTGGLEEMERNAATEIREFCRNFELKMQEYEALGGSAEKARAFRSEVSSHANNFLQRLEAVGIVEPQEDF
jgi:hypothetical protein